MSNKSKKGFEFSFGWIFAIIVGAAILSMAIYGAVKIMDTGRYGMQSFAGKQLGVILNPVEAGLSASQITPIHFQVRTRVYNDCDNIGNFGRQFISTSIQSGIGEEWDKPSAKSIFYDKYIFSASTIEGNNIFAFSKSFNFPFKVADLIYLFSAEDQFCFVNPPVSIQQELEELNMSNMNISTIPSACSKKSIKVCFMGSGCDIQVNLNTQSVKKYNYNLYYIDDEGNTLLYAAIFSDPSIYECQIKRLMKRTSALSSVYYSKSQALSPRGCSSGMDLDLIDFANMTLALNSSIKLREIVPYSANMEEKNDALACKLF